MVSTATFSASDEDEIGKIPQTHQISTATVGMDEDDDPMGRIPDPKGFEQPQKIVYGANTVELSCDLDAEFGAQTQEMTTQYERPQEPFNNPGMMELMVSEMGRAQDAQKIGNIAKLMSSLPDFVSSYGET